MAAPFSVEQEVAAGSLGACRVVADLAIPVLAMALRLRLGAIMGKLDAPGGEMQNVRYRVLRWEEAW